MQIFNDRKKRIGTLSGFKDRAITTTLDSGDKEMTFVYPASGALVGLLQEEYYIRTKTDEFVIKAVEKGNSSTNTPPSSMWRNWRERRSRMGLNRMNRQSEHVLSLRSRVRGGVLEHARSQRKEPLTSRRTSRRGMSCKSAYQHIGANVSLIQSIKR